MVINCLHVENIHKKSCGCGVSSGWHFHPWVSLFPPANENHGLHRKCDNPVHPWHGHVTFHPGHAQKLPYMTIHAQSCRAPKGLMHVHAKPEG